MIAVFLGELEPGEEDKSDQQVDRNNLQHRREDLIAEELKLPPDDEIHRQAQKERRNLESTCFDLRRKRRTASISEIVTMIKVDLSTKAIHSCR